MVIEGIEGISEGKERQVIAAPRNAATARAGVP